MNVKEYLHQSYRLDQRIKSDTMEAQNLREMAGSVSAIQYDQDRVQSSRSTDAPFIRALEKLWELEKKIAAELETLSALKKQIRGGHRGGSGHRRAHGLEVSLHPQLHVGADRSGT